MNNWKDCSAADPRGLRQVLGSFMTGVTVVATRLEDGQVRAFTANSFTSVSLDPPLVLVCLLKTSPSLAVFRQARTFSISILAEHQREVSHGFASRDPHIKTAAQCNLTDVPTPYVRDSLAVLECEPDQVIDAGDHVILLGRVRRYSENEGMPLGFFRGAYVGAGHEIREQEALFGRSR